MNIIYEIKNHKSPGFDHIWNDDIKSAILEETSEDKVPPEQKIVLLVLIFNILTNFWFNMYVPRDFKRTVLRPFLNHNDEDSSDPSKLQTDFPPKCDDENIWGNDL